MFSIALAILMLSYVVTVLGLETTTPSSQDQTLTPEYEKSVPPYIPHATYPYAELYPVQYPGKGSFLYPNNQPFLHPVQETGYMSSVMPAAQAALQVAVRLFSKVGLFLVGGAALLAVGGVFMAAFCSITPFCTITFNGLGIKGIDKESVRAMMTPDKISAAAALVQDAIGKYQRLQRTVGK